MKAVCAIVVLVVLAFLLPQDAEAGDTLFVRFQPYRYNNPKSLEPVGGWKAVDVFIASTPDSSYTLLFIGTADSATPVYRKFSTGSKFEKALQRPLNRDFAAERADAGKARAGRGETRGEVVKHKRERGLRVVRVHRTQQIPSSTINNYYTTVLGDTSKGSIRDVAASSWKSSSNLNISLGASIAGVSTPEMYYWAPGLSLSIGKEPVFILLAGHWRPKQKDPTYGRLADAIFSVGLEIYPTSSWWGIQGKFSIAYEAIADEFKFLRDTPGLTVGPTARIGIGDNLLLTGNLGIQPSTYTQLGSASNPLKLGFAGGISFSYRLLK